ncbi:MAG: hypothetical protein JRJ13_08860 [Deltaproteobacteria bacterium]|nr:hypothetical protein [Deltaproteobacteria bacterium]MBW2026646.1 hypothetical protein [Deltaproteobacteria bacterium]
MDEIDLKKLDSIIGEIESAVNKLTKEAKGIQAIERNADRILASTKMLKINVSDVLADFLGS